MRPHSYASRLGPAEGFLPTAPGALSYVVLYSRVAAAGGWTVDARASPGTCSVVISTLCCVVRKAAYVYYR